MTNLIFMFNFCLKYFKVDFLFKMITQLEDASTHLGN